MTTTDGYVIDESGRLDNYAVEPEIYVEPNTYDLILAGTTKLNT